MDIRNCADGEHLSGALDSAALVISQGRLIVMPTDTVYGVGADAFNPAAVANLLAAKGRGRDMPPPVLVAGQDMAQALADALPEAASILIEKFWPGALTIIVNAQPALAWDLGDTRGTVALRMPDSDIALQLLERTGPLAVSSANTTGNPAATDAATAAEMLGESVSLYLDGGDAPGQVASTIVDLTGTPARILRQGAISREDIAALIDLEPEAEQAAAEDGGEGPAERTDSGSGASEQLGAESIEAETSEGGGSHGEKTESETAPGQPAEVVEAVEEVSPPPSRAEMGRPEP